MSTPFLLIDYIQFFCFLYRAFSSQFHRATYPCTKNPHLGDNCNFGVQLHVEQRLLFAYSCTTLSIHLYRTSSAFLNSTGSHPHILTTRVQFFSLLLSLLPERIWYYQQTAHPLPWAVNENSLYLSKDPEGNLPVITIPCRMWSFHSCSPFLMFQPFLLIW